MGLYDKKFGAFMVDAGGDAINTLNAKYGGSTDGTTIQDTAIIAALADISTSGPPGVLRLAPGITHVIDNVTLDRPVVIDFRGAILKKSTNTVGHMFQNLDAAADGSMFIGYGGEVNMMASAFSSGQTVSAFHMVRGDQLGWYGGKYHTGIEEGLKLYNCQNIDVRDGWYEDFANNGVQCNGVSSSADGFTGSKAQQDLAFTNVSGNYFKDMDDQTAGEGQGVAVGSGSTTNIARDIVIADNTLDNCNRSIWCENNNAALQAKNVSVTGNVIRNPITFGVGVVGAIGVNVTGNTVEMNSPSTTISSESAGIIISGSASSGGNDADSKNVAINSNSVYGSSSAMDYGLLIRRTQGITAPGTNFFTGSALQALDSDGWDNVSGAYVFDQSPICRTGAASAAATTTGTWEDINWGERRFDPYSMNSSSTASSQKLVPAWPGQWQITVTDSWPTNAVGERGLRILKDDGGTSTVVAEMLLSASTGDDTGLEVTGHAELDPGSSEFFRAQRFQASGGDLTASSTTDRVGAVFLIVGGTT